MIPTEAYRKIVDQIPIVCIDAVIVNDRKEYLLIRRKNEPLKGEYWVPGGRLLKNERLDDAVHRKVRQELGIDAHIIMPVGIYEGFFDKSPFPVETGLHTVSIVYLMTANSEGIRLDEQSDDWGWFAELPKRLKRMTTLNLPSELVR